MIDIFRRRTPKEQKKRRKRRTKRLREKLAAEAAEASGDDGADFDPSAVSAPRTPVVWWLVCCCSWPVDCDDLVI